MKRVLMLLANAWATDSRVIREATALSRAGHEVHVICAGDRDTFESVTSDGVTYHCLPPVNGRALIQHIPRMMLLHQRVLLAGVTDSWNAGKWAQATGRALALFALVLGSGVALACGAVLLAPVVALRVLLDGLARTLGFTLRPLFPKSHAGHGALLDVYATVMRGFAWFSRKLWGLTYRILRLVDFESVQYLDQFGARAFALACRLHPDIVHAHDLVTLSGGYAVARAMGAPLIYDAHELETHTNYWGLPRQTKQWIECYESVLARRCDRIITVCESIADWLRDTYAVQRPVVVHNSPDLDHVATRQATTHGLRQHLGLAGDVPLAVYVGSVTVDRGMRECVEALAFSPRLHMAFVGPRQRVTEKQMLDTADRLGVRPRIHLIDPVPSDQVPGFVSDADCSVIAIQNVCLSYYFCFPNKLLESVLAGVPVVAARLIELERFVARFGVGVIADETDPKAIAAAVDAVIAERARYKPDEQTRQRIAAEYGWANQRRKLLELYGGLRAAPDLVEGREPRKNAPAI